MLILQSQIKVCVFSQIFDLGSIIFSDKLVKALKSTAVVSSVLTKVSSLTNTKLTQTDGRYVLCGRIDDLLSAKQLINNVRIVVNLDNLSKNISCSVFCSVHFMLCSKAFLYHFKDHF